jgi:hypothetical protein
MLDNRNLDKAKIQDQMEHQKLGMKENIRIEKEITYQPYYVIDRL